MATTSSTSVATVTTARITPVVAVEDVQAVLGYQFANMELLLEALKAAGSGLNLSRNPASTDGNKRIAQVGDGAMKLALAVDWYHSENTRAFLNRQVSTACAADNLANCGRNFQLQNYISTNPSQGSEPPTASLIAITVQALLGAVWIDSGHNLQLVRYTAERLGLLQVGADR